MISKLLIANRGEIAVRVVKTCQRLGVPSVVVYSDADAGSRAVEMADEAVRIGPAAAAQSYLNIDAVLDAMRQTGADGVHPGFGFLAENAGFARAVEAAGATWVGPHARSIEVMGDKIASKKLAQEAGVPIVPGHPGAVDDAKAAAKAAKAIGYPVMLKASAGGGGKGMRPAFSADELDELFDSARREAEGAFGDGRLLVEKLILSPRHIEVQVLADKRGNVIHLGERECSIQRRNQKVLEEAPSPFLDEDTRQAMGAQAVALAKAVDYDSAGTVEFIVDADKGFYFLEMNTRIQVEHPVTEMITGVDIVEEMIRAAAGEPLSVGQDAARATGWAMEARVYAEDPARGFLPSIGRLRRYRTPAEGPNTLGEIRIDSGVREGDEVSPHYDPMIAKVVAHGADREASRVALLDALDRYEIEGLQTNLDFLSAVLDQPRYRDGALTTAYLAEEFPDGFAGVAASDDQSRCLLAVAAYAHAFSARRARAPSDRAASGEERALAVALDGDAQAVRVQLSEDGALLRLGEDDAPMRLETAWRPGGRRFQGRLDGRAFIMAIAPTSDGYELRWRGVRTHAVAAHPRAMELRALLPEKAASGSGKHVESPMPGLVATVLCAPGQAVKAGDGLLVVEAMKMENIVRAERDGVIQAIPVAPGDSVAAGDVLAEFE